MPDEKVIPRLISKYLAEMGRAGGKARAKSLSPQKLKAQARKAANARWAQDTPPPATPPKKARASHAVA
jgi:hypothetical protein